MHQSELSSVQRSWASPITPMSLLCLVTNRDMHSCVIWCSVEVPSAVSIQRWPCHLGLEPVPLASLAKWRRASAGAVCPSGGCLRQMTWFRKADQFGLSGHGCTQNWRFSVDKEVVKCGLHMGRERKRMDRSISTPHSKNGVPPICRTAWQEPTARPGSTGSSSASGPPVHRTRVMGTL